MTLTYERMWNWVHAAIVALCLTVGALPGLAQDIQAVTNFPDLVALVNQPWTNTLSIIPPGNISYQTDLGILSYPDGFAPDFMATLLPVTNKVVEMFPVMVIETNTNPRQRFYLNSAGQAVYTTTVSVAGYPSNSIVTTYGAVPAYLDATNRGLWFDERDPMRQRVMFNLLSQSNVSAYCAAISNAMTVTLDETNIVYLLDLYSNDIAFVKTGVRETGVFEYYLHAPASIPLLDLYVSTNLLDPLGGWNFPARLNHSSDPLCGVASGMVSPVFFASGNPAVDSDGDGIPDCMEQRLFGTDSYFADTDGDGLADGVEILKWGCSPLLFSSDGSGMADGEKIALCLNPNSADTDQDGASDVNEITGYFTDPLDSDSDNDGLLDGAEIQNHTYPGYNDTDNDGLTDKQEIDLGTNPLLADTDGDGINDDYEHSTTGWDPLDPSNAGGDDDSDGFTNLQEYQWCYSPKYSNTHDYVQRLIVVPPGVNGIRTIADSTHYRMLAAGDWSHKAKIWVRPLGYGTNTLPQRLHRPQTPGFYINGVEASGVSSPIDIPAVKTNIEFIITSSSAAWGTNILFRLTKTNDTEGTYCRIYVYSPKLTQVYFSTRTSSANGTNVNFGATGTLYYCWSGTNSQSTNVFLDPDQSPSQGYGIPYFHWNDWCRFDVTGTAACHYQTNTLNVHDYKSALGYGNSPRYTKGITLDPGVFRINVGFDMNGDAALQEDERQQSCNFIAIKADLAVDSDNDGTIGASDDDLESFAPGKIIYADKDAFLRDGTNDSDVVEVNVNFDAGGAVVPTNCSALLQWMDSSMHNSSVDIFMDASCTQPLEQTPFTRGHLYVAGDTVPDKVYLRASPDALNGFFKPLEYTEVAQLVDLIVNRTDVSMEIGRDTVRLTIANRPAKSPTGNSFYFWEEELTRPDTHHYNEEVWNSLNNDLVGDSVHTNPYVQRWYRAVETNLTPQKYEALKEASILLTSHHGGTGCEFPVAFTNTPEGFSQADAWASELGTNWAQPFQDIEKNCYFVQVNTSYFAEHWKAQRDANNAILFAGSCYAADSVTGITSYIEAAGGAFRFGSYTSTRTDVEASFFSDIINQMRISCWRTAYGAWYVGRDDYSSFQFGFVGLGKITLWPGLLNGSEKAYYPKEHHTNGVAMVLFDTELQHSAFPLIKLSGDAHMTGSLPEWMNTAAVRWPYWGDTSRTTKTRLKIDAWTCVTPWTGVEFNGKWFSSDGKSCGRDQEWEF